MPAKKKSGKKSTAKKTSAQNSLDAALILTPAQQIAQLQLKLERVKQLREHLASVKPLYQEHDQLMAELMPLFIEVQDDKFIFNREVKIGGKTYKLSPNFYDEKHGQLVPKVWKSTAMSMAHIV